MLKSIHFLLVKPARTSMFKLSTAANSIAYTLFPELRRMTPDSSDNPLLDGERQVNDGAKDVEAQRKYRQSRYWAYGVGALVLLVISSFVLLLLFGSHRSTGNSPSPPQSSSLSLEEMRTGAYEPEHPSYHWLGDSLSGEFLTKSHDGTQFIIKTLEDDDYSKLVSPGVIQAGDGDYRIVYDVLVNSDRSKAIVKTDYKKNFRHSSFGHFWIMDISSQSFEPLIPEHQDALVSTGQFSPDGEKIAYVLENNLYVREIGSKSIHKVTFDGDANIFNGVPDWVYEEEVFSGDTAFWWSRNSNYLMYLRTNDTQVPTYPLEYFVKEGADQYPSIVDINYPKPGVANPIDDLYVYDFSKEATHLVPIDLPEKIVTEVIWADSEAIVKVMTRDSDTLQVMLVDAPTHKAQVVRKYDALDDGGWFEITHNSVFVPKGNGRKHDGYIDTLTVDGYNHLGYFSPLNSSKPTVLTSGEWEVADIEYAFNPKTNKVFFTGTKEAPTRQNIYEVDLLEPKEPVAITKEGTYAATYSGGATHAVISYLGPHIPWTEVRELKENRVRITHGNAHLEETLANRSLPTAHFSQVEVAKGIQVNVREIRPSSFDKSKKYPVLFYNYGGPGSQMVLESFGLNFQSVYAETHNAIVVTVDPRGTGFMGRKFRSIVRDRLGYYESRDVISVAKQWNKKPYVDSNVTAIWGWSYGGFLTLKTLEVDGGNEFKFGVAVAPVTDWTLYDSIYTERYMHTPQENPKGYAQSAINDVDSLGKSRRFMIMHGTGDDNVHIQNTYRLLDKFDEAGIENYDIHVYPDSDHSIYFHNANLIVYDKLDKWLYEHQNIDPSDEQLMPMARG